MDLQHSNSNYVQKDTVMVFAWINWGDKVEKITIATTF